MALDTGTTAPRPIALYDYCCQNTGSGTFPAISVTGKRCALGCAHCNGVFLCHMTAATTPRELGEFLDRLWAHGGVGSLISGGCGLDGRVPLRPFIPTIAAVKRETGLVLNVHPGLADAEDARLLAEAGVDAVSIDLVGSRETAEAVYGLDKGPDDYLASYRSLVDAGLHVVPHVTIGLHFGKVKGERAALAMAVETGAELVVLNVILPTKDTGMERTAPPADHEIAAVFDLAREMLPHAELALGCMRPRGSKGRAIERLAIDRGFARIAMAPNAAAAYAASRGYATVRVPGCCAHPAPRTSQG